MNQRNRTYNSVLNIVIGFLDRIIAMLLAFGTRSVFIKMLSEDFLGINGLFGNILAVLSITELGFGVAMVYSMYKPLAERNFEKLSQLLYLYKKVYRTIGCIILFLGLSVLPFMDKLIKGGTNVKYISFYYVLYLLGSVVSYWFFAYQQSVLQADQKGYVISTYNCIFNVIKAAFQTFLLIEFRSYALYLITLILCKVCENLFVAYRVHKVYPKINKNIKKKLPYKDIKKIFSDVKALLLAKIANIILTCTDNIIISSFVGINWVGLLSNYTIITDVLTSVFSQFSTAMQASLGNFFVKKESDEGFLLFKRITFLNFWIYGFAMIALITLLNPFITLWLGEKYVISFPNSIALGINFFIAGMVNNFWTFRSALGLFKQGKYRPIIASILNVVLSIIFSFKWEISGILFATTISTVLINLWYGPWVLHKYAFKKNIVPFFKAYIYRFVILFITLCLVLFVENKFVFINGIYIGNFILMISITAILPNIIMIVFFFKQEEFKYIIYVMLFLIGKIFRKDILIIRATEYYKKL